MSIVDEVASDQQRWKRGDCQTCAWIRSRPAKEQPEWHTAMLDDSFSHSSILRAMRRRTGSDTPGESSVGKHRRSKHTAEYHSR